MKTIKHRIGVLTMIKNVFRNLLCLGGTAIMIYAFLAALNLHAQSQKGKKCTITLQYIYPDKAPEKPETHSGNRGQSITLECEDEDNYVFHHWEGVPESLRNKRKITFIVEKDMQIKLYFKEKKSKAVTPAETRNEKDSGKTKPLIVDGGKKPGDTSKKSNQQETHGKTADTTGKNKKQPTNETGTKPLKLPDKKDKPGKIIAGTTGKNQGQIKDLQKPPVIIPGKLEKPEPTEPPQIVQHKSLTRVDPDDCFYFLDSGTIKRIDKDGETKEVEIPHIEAGDGFKLYNSRYPDEQGFGSRFFCLYTPSPLEGENTVKAIIIDKNSIGGTPIRYPLEFNQQPYSIDIVYPADYPTGPREGNAEAIVICKTTPESNYDILRFALTEENSFKEIQKLASNIMLSHFFYNKVGNQLTWIIGKKLFILQYGYDNSIQEYELPLSPAENLKEVVASGDLIILHIITDNKRTIKFFKIRENLLNLELSIPASVFCYSISKGVYFFFIKTPTEWKVFRFQNSELRPYPIPYPLAQYTRDIRDIKMIRDGSLYYLAMMNQTGESLKISIQRLEDSFIDKPTSPPNKFSIPTPHRESYSFFVEGTMFIAVNISQTRVERVYRLEGYNFKKVFEIKQKKEEFDL